MTCLEGSLVEERGPTPRSGGDRVGSQSEGSEASDAAGALRAADRAVALAGSAAEVAWGLVRRAAAMARLGDHEGCLGACAQATQRLTALGDDLGVARALGLAAVVLTTTGRMREGAAAATEGLAAAGRVRGASIDLAAVHSDLAAALSALGDPAADGHDRQAIRLARASGDPAAALRFRTQAVARASAAMRRDWQSGDDAGVRTAATALLPEARRALAEAVVAREALQEAILRAATAELLVRAGEPGRAIGELAGAVTVAVALGQPHLECTTLLTLGGALRAGGHEREAAEHLEAALRQARALALVGHQADAHHERSLLFEALGRDGDALAEHRRFHRLAARMRLGSGWGARPGLATGAGGGVGGDPPGRRIDEVSSLVDELWAQSRALARASLEDPLTGLANRRRLDAVLAERRGAPPGVPRSRCVAMIDVDRFKEVNDRHGHLAGDEVLRAVAAAMRRHFREGDALARFGGDEFVVVLEAAPGDALAACQRFCRGIAAADWDAVREGLRVTVSVGVGASEGSGDLSEAVSAADAALYRAKRDGRDRVVLGGSAAGLVEAPG